MIEVSADIPMPVIFPTDTIPAPKNAALLKSH